MIINIRGTHGSGKSTTIKNMLTLYKAQPESVNHKGKALHYQMTISGKPAYAVGNYDKACGGCDSIQPYSLIWPEVVRLAALGHVLFEGALVSSSYGNIGRASETYGDQFIFAFLNTPLSVCLARIQQRRLDRGDHRPLNPKNTEGKFNSIHKSIEKIRALQRRVVILDHQHPENQILELLNNG